MKLLLPLLAATLLTVTASAQDKPPAKPSGTFSICLWPNPCGAAGKAPAAPKPEAPKVESVPSSDPLTRAVVNGTVARGDDGIVSSIRLSPAHTGTEHEQIITRGTGLRDALAPISGAALPGSKVPANKNAAKGAAEDEWVTVDSNSASAGQLNDMRTERKASKSSGEAGAAATGRMFKTQK